MASNTDALNGWGEALELYYAKENGYNDGYDQACQEMNGEIDQAFRNGYTKGINDSIHEYNMVVTEANTAFGEKNREICRLKTLLDQHGIKY